MSSYILLLGDCEKVDCVHIFIRPDNLTCNTVMVLAKTNEEHCKSHRTPSVKITVFVKINVFGPIANQMTFNLWTL